MKWLYNTKKMWFVRHENIIVRHENMFSGLSRNFALKIKDFNLYKQ